MPINDPKEAVMQMRLCTYKGAEFLVTGSAVSGGRKDALHEFVNSDLQSVEDLGLRNRGYTLSGITQAKRDNDGTILVSYKEAKAKLLMAVESGGPGVLIHPWGETLNNMAVRAYTLDETQNQMGVARWSITFAVSNLNPAPLEAFNTPALIAHEQEVVELGTIEEIANNFATSGAAGGNAASAVTKLGELTQILGDSSKTAIRTGDVITRKFNELQKDIGAFNTSVNSLIAVPRDLARATANLVRGLDGMFADAIDSYFAVQEMFDFGENDLSYEGSQTHLSLQRDNNTNVLNNSVRAQSLSYSYLSASQLNLATVVEIEGVATALEDQYQKLLASDVGKDLLASVTEQRNSTTELFEQQKLNARRLVTVRTNPTTFRLLSYKHYGESTQGDDLALLNGSNNMDVTGNVEILTP